MREQSFNASPVDQMISVTHGRANEPESWGQAPAWCNEREGGGYHNVISNIYK